MILRDLIGLSYDKALAIAVNNGYLTRKLENTCDDRHRYDSELVVRATMENGTVVLVTSRFALEI